MKTFPKNVADVGGAGAAEITDAAVTAPYHPKTLRTAEAARYLGVSASTLNKLRVYGNGPVFCRLGRAIRYRTDDLEIWMLGRRAVSTTDADHRLPRRLVDVDLRSTAPGAANVA